MNRLAQLVLAMSLSTQAFALFSINWESDPLSRFGDVVMSYVKGGAFELKDESRLAPCDDQEIPGDSPIALCDSEEEQLLHITQVVIDPNPPEPGANLTVAADGVLDVTIDEGSYVDVLVQYGFIQLINKRYDLCEVLPEADLECPVEKGALSLTRSFEVPGSVPPGEYFVTARAYTKDDELITCLYADIVFEA